MFIHGKYNKIYANTDNTTIMSLAYPKVNNVTSFFA